MLTGHYDSPRGADDRRPRDGTTYLERRGDGQAAGRPPVQGAGYSTTVKDFQQM